MKKETIILALVFLLVLGIRLFLSFQTQTFSSEESYFHLREIKKIIETGLPFFHDELSFGGRERVFSPIFDYVIAFFAKTISFNFATKVIPNLLASLVVLIIYSIILKITNDSKTALFGAFAGGFIPVFMEQTTNVLSSLTIVTPLLLLLTRLLLSLNSTRSCYFFLATLIISSFISPLIIIFALGILIYLLILKLERIKQEKKESEIIFFSIFFILWAQFIVYKRIFMFHGPSIVWQNIPTQILSEYFSRITILQGIYEIGMIPFFLGIYAIYKYLFIERKKEEYLIISFSFATGLLLALKLIELKTGLMFLGFFLTILFASWFKNFILFLKKTKFEDFRSLIQIMFVLLLIATSVYPAYHNTSKNMKFNVEEKEIEALNWLKENSATDSTIFASPEDGNLINAVAERKNVIDGDFLLVKDAKQRYEDIEKTFTTTSYTDAVETVEKHKSKYIYLSKNTQKNFKTDDSAFTKEKCFLEIFDNGVAKIYERVCRMRIYESR